jgi:predicted nuclease of predicted toxin-antitoxin system
LRIFIDACVDPRVAELFPDHAVTTAFDVGWDTYPDPEIARLCAGRFDVLLTADRGFEHQLNLKRLSFGILIVHVPQNRVGFYRDILPD